MPPLSVVQILCPYRLTSAANIGGEGLTLSFTDYEVDQPQGEKFSKRRSSAKQKRNRLNRPPRTAHDQAFKCVHCKQFIGAPIAGGRHRNHCPNCLWSRHVDASHPGDRASECHAAMEPIGRIVRRNGEQVLIHRCRGCGKHDPNRIAADDNPLLLMRLPLLDATTPAVEEAAAADEAMA